MSKVVNPIVCSISDFVTNTYNLQKKNILFWDTCALLEIIRFIYRNNGDVNTYRAINTINGYIQSDSIYSIASSITIKEWNDNEAIVTTGFRDSLVKTTDYHKNSIDVINEINSTSLVSESLHNKRLLFDLEILAQSVLSKTIFLETDEIANNSLVRICNKLPPANKKNEFKDCAVWETMRLVSELIENTKAPTDSFEKVFYTVNTDDFIDKSREPKIFHGQLLSEASILNFICCKDINETYAAIIP